MTICKDLEHALKYKWEHFDWGNSQSCAKFIEPILKNQLQHGDLVE